MRKQHTRPQAGFSLLEMLLVVAILTIVLTAVFMQINTVQKRYSNEVQRIDISQESREFFDQIVRDLHQNGWPNSKMYDAATLMNPAINDSRNAVGLVKFAADEIWFEGDIDGDGNVESVNYKLLADSTGKCPCTLARSVVKKANATAPTAQSISYNTGLGDVVNSGGVYSISGTSQLSSGAVSNNTLYSAYKGAKLFTAYNSDGVETAVLADIRTIKINLNLLASRADLQTRMRPAVTLAASVRLPAN
jgi:prepilin-type N-terminal cleavage/methylation domain-containing protein